MSSPDGAITELRRDAMRRADSPEGWATLGNALLELGRFDEAIEALARVVTLQPAAAGAYAALGGAMRTAGRREEAIVLYRDAVARDPALAAAWNDLGAVLRDAGHGEEALDAFDRAVTLAPTEAGFLYNRGVVLTGLGRLGEARQAFAAAIATHSRRADVYYAYGNVLRDLGELRAAVAAFRQAVQLDPAHGNAWSNLLFTLNFISGETDTTLVRANRDWAATIDSGLPYSPAVTREPDRKLRIGYVSSEFRRHHFLTVFLPVLRAHDRGNFHIACYADVATPDSDTDTVARMSDSFRNLHGHDHAAQAAIIRADKIDILVSLTGYLANDRMLFARRMAPVQATYLNHVTTTGLRAVDARIADAFLDPLGSEVPGDPETPVRLATGLGIFTPPDDAPAPGEPPMLATGYPTFGTFNTLLKVTDQTIALWAGLLGRLKTARLLIKARELSQPDVLAAFRRRLSAAGIDLTRCELVGHIADRRANLLFYARADIGLDPVPFTGGATTREMLWMGLPVVTLAGATRVSRIGASLMHCSGVGEFVAANAEGYVRIAASLAADPQRLRELRAGLRDRLRGSKLLDAVGHTRELESAYRRLWQDWCSRVPAV